MNEERILNKYPEETDDKVFSQVIKAGRRTYFVDVRSTRTDDYYITLTESRKRMLEDGTVCFDRHKIFLYKEDFAKLESGLIAAIEFVKRAKPDFFLKESETDRRISLDEEFDNL